MKDLPNGKMYGLKGEIIDLYPNPQQGFPTTDSTYYPKTERVLEEEVIPLPVKWNSETRARLDNIELQREAVLGIGRYSGNWPR